MAGGTDLLGLLEEAAIAPEAAVNLKALPGMRSIEPAEGQGLLIGGLVTAADLAENALAREKAAFWPRPRPRSLPRSSATRGPWVATSASAAVPVLPGRLSLHEEGR